MNKLKIKILLLIMFVSSQIMAQYNIRGNVFSKDDTTKVVHCKVYLNHKLYTTYTDSTGKFEFNNLPQGHYTIHTSDISFHNFKKVIDLVGKDEYVRIELLHKHKTTEEVVVVAKQNNNYMKAVENMGIYEGKKTEVIQPDKLTVNLATNNARQVYSRVAGLNIFENDGAGLQLSVGARGLDPNRTSNFNVRQNGYDISADALGYPESYYTPPIEAIEKIQIVRGAASLQFGTQFGGLLNFVMRKPVEDKKVQLVARQSTGSFGFYNTFTSLSGTVKKLSYYTFFQYKRGDGWRPNSQFENYNFYTNVNYKFSDKASLGLDFTHMNYLAKQPGGLNDEMFKENPLQSNRDRNWFKVNWNMLALHFNYKFNVRTEFNFRAFGLLASRYSLGFRDNRISTIDSDKNVRDLIKGDFENWGFETRLLKWYQIKNKDVVFLVGSRFYSGYNHSTQGDGQAGKDANFNYVDPAKYTIYDYSFPNQNISLFIENIFYIKENLTLTPGLRYENIYTTAQGYYGKFAIDLADNKTFVKVQDERRNNGRQFVIGGIGLSYKPIEKINIYTNISQNYRSITFSDMRISNPSQVIDPNLQDEKGYTFDIGLRTENTKNIVFDVSCFYLNYSNRIGEIQIVNDKGQILRRRGNIGKAAIMGVESYIESDLFKLLNPKNEDWSATVFTNIAFINSKYLASEEKGVAGNEVEFVPSLNTKYGLRGGYKKLKASIQYNYTSSQFSDATNTVDGGFSAVIGLIPSYAIIDFSTSYEYKIFKIEGSINNLANAMYFTRRATGYPGPGILPSDGRGFYITLQVKI
jgi:Fe(3+) dicitrate transport protein